ncbi:MAG: 50S ribosomal protein L22 [Bacteroidales bacterium]|nr:50S ribosomal protein L22 [Bacteroidales bacterium]
MGARKRDTANRRKEARKTTYQAVLRNCPTSPRKMRLVTDMIKGMDVNRALDVLKFSSKEASRRVEKLLLSAISNWQQKNEGSRIEESNLIVKEAFVDGGRMLKRLQTAPQGRAYRVRKRSNHVTLIIDSKLKEVETTSN